MATVRELVTRFTVQASTAKLSGFNAAVEATRGSLLRFGAAGAAVAAGLGVGIAVNSLSKDFGRFEKSLASAGNIMQATEKQMKLLKNAALDAGIATQFSPDQAVGGLEKLGAAGLSVKDSMKTLRPVLDLAAASMGQLGVGSAASNVVGVLNAFGETSQSAAKRVDQLVRVTQLTNFQAEDFQVAISNAAAAAKGANQSFESMLAVLGLLRNTNLDASSASTAYREAVRRVSGEQKAINKLMALGVNPINKQTGGIKDLSQIVAELAPRISRLDATQRGLALNAIFGARGSKAFNAILGGYNKLLKEGKVEAGDFAGATKLIVGQLGNAEGAAGKARDAFLKTSAGQRELLKGSIQTLKIQLGQLITPILLPAIRGATSLINSMISGLRGVVGPLGEALADRVGAIRSAVGEVFSALGEVFSALGPIIAEAFAAMQPIFKLGNTVIKILAKQLKWVLKLVAKAVKAAAKIIIPIHRIAANVLGQVLAVVGRIFQRAMPVLQRIFALVGKAINVIGKIFGVFGQIFTKVFQAMQKLGVIKPLLKFMEVTGKITLKIWNGIITAIEKVASLAKKVAQNRVVRFFGGGATTLADRPLEELAKRRAAQVKEQERRDAAQRQPLSATVTLNVAGGSSVDPETLEKIKAASRDGVKQGLDAAARRGVNDRRPVVP